MKSELTYSCVCGLSQCVQTRGTSHRRRTRRRRSEGLGEVWKLSTASPSRSCKSSCKLWLWKSCSCRGKATAPCYYHARRSQNHTDLLTKPQSVNLVEVHSPQLPGSDAQCPHPPPKKFPDEEKKKIPLRHEGFKVQWRFKRVLMWRGLIWSFLTRSR